MDNICRNCKHFRKHYVKFGRSFKEISDGHCVYPMLKTRRADTKACEHIRERKPTQPAQ